MATTLTPVNPSAGQQQVARILPIRANLLPTEILEVRNARRMRVIAIAAVVVVAVALGGWYYAARQSKATADAENARISAEIATVHAAMAKSPRGEVTTTVHKTDALVKQLKTATADDAPWSTFLTEVRTVGTSKDMSITAITAAISTTATSTAAALPTTSTATVVGTLSITGTAKDKNTVAGLIEKLPSVTGVANPYLTTASQAAGTLSYTITADITAKLLCGRYAAKHCSKSGGK